MMEIDHHVFPISNGDFPILGGCFSHLQTTPVKLLYVLYVVWQHFVTLIGYVPIFKKNLSLSDSSGHTLKKVNQILFVKT